MEVAHGDAEHVTKVEAMFPRVVKKMRKVDDDSSMMEECESSSPRLVSFVADLSPLVLADYDMIFADDEQASNPASLKFLQLAAAWKEKQAALAASAPSVPATEEENGEDDDDDDDDEEEEGSEEEE